MADTGPVNASQADLATSSEGLADHGVFEAAVRKTRMAMAIVDPNLPDQPVIYVNGAFTKLTGYEAKSVIGRNCRFLQGAETDRQSVLRIREAISEQRQIVEEIYNYRRDGSGFWNALFISPIFGENGKLEYFFASQADVSLRREISRRQARRADNFSALISGVAHQFNNLMTVVLGSVEQAASMTSAPQPSRHLQRATWGAKRAGQIVEELLALVTREPAEDTVVELGQVVREFASKVENTLPSGISLQSEIEQSPMQVRLGRDQLLRALDALMRNALDAMPKGGFVRLVTRRQPASSVYGSATVELEVGDTGPGMPPQVRQRATEVFFTTRSANSGLGLFLVLDFVEKYGGSLAIDSEPGRGTAVRMVFPDAT